MIDGKWIIFKHQVNDFAIAAPDQRTANILLDMLDKKLSMPIKRQGLLDMFNGVNVVQTQDYIKLIATPTSTNFAVSTLKHGSVNCTSPMIVPLHSLQEIKNGSRDLIVPQAPSTPRSLLSLNLQMQIKYHASVGELIWAMTTCRPDLAYASVKLSQLNSTPAEIHFHGLKHAIRYLYTTQHDGIYFWQMAPRHELPHSPLLPVKSNLKDLLLDARPNHDASVAVAYGDSDWATCVKTRRSFSGICIQLAGGMIAYKTKFQPRVALSTTEAEFMAACDVGCMSIFVRSILWDLNIPQEAATVVYEDNDGCTAMGNAQKPTAHTRHIDIKYFALCEWVERDLIHLKRIDTSINIADHLTKPLSKVLFHWDANFLLGHIPPKYSPVHSHAITTYGNTFMDIDKFVPTLFTTPTTVKLHGCLFPLTMMFGATLGSQFFGMIRPIHTYGANCRGVLVYT